METRNRGPQSKNGQARGDKEQVRMSVEKLPTGRQTSDVLGVVTRYRKQMRETRATERGYANPPGLFSRLTLSRTSAS